MPLRKSGEVDTSVAAKVSFLLEKAIVLPVMISACSACVGLSFEHSNVNKHLTLLGA